MNELSAAPRWRPEFRPLKPMQRDIRRDQIEEKKEQRKMLNHTGLSARIVEFIKNNPGISRERLNVHLEEFTSKHITDALSKTIKAGKVRNDDGWLFAQALDEEGPAIKFVDPIVVNESKISFGFWSDEEFIIRSGNAEIHFDQAMAKKLHGLLAVYLEVEEV